MEHDAVAEELDGSPTEGLGRSCDQLGQSSGELGGCLIARVLRQARITTEIQEGDGRLP